MMKYLKVLFYYFILLSLFYFEIVLLCCGSKSEKKKFTEHFQYITNQLPEYVIQIDLLGPISMTSLLWNYEVVDRRS